MRTVATGVAASHFGVHPPPSRPRLRQRAFEATLWMVDTDRFGDHRRAFDSNDRESWTPGCSAPVPQADPVAVPSRLPAISSAAAVIAGDFDFLRVDLYEAGGEVWFGELTAYSGSSLSRLIPRSYDFEWGAKWSLPRRSAR